MLGEVFERFVEKSPLSVMVRASLERVLGADRLDLWFERTAHKQYTRDLLFSSVYDMMNQVVFCVQPCVLPTGMLDFSFCIHYIRHLITTDVLALNGGGHHDVSAAQSSQNPAGSLPEPTTSEGVA
jgi:hypothetical protein